MRGVIIQRDDVFDSARGAALAVSARQHPARRNAPQRDSTRAADRRRRSATTAPWSPNRNGIFARSGSSATSTSTRCQTDTGLVLVVRTADAWTTTLGVNIAASGGSESIIDLSLQEGNLLGTRTAAQIAYRNDPDRSSIAAGFDTPRAIGERIGIGASFVERSDGRGGTASIRRPFLSLSSKTGWSLSSSVFQGRVLQFASGVISDSLWRESALLRLDAASCDPRESARVHAPGTLRPVPAR